VEWRLRTKEKPKLLTPDDTIFQLQEAEIVNEDISLEFCIRAGEIAGALKSSSLLLVSPKTTLLLSGNALRGRFPLGIE